MLTREVLKLWVVYDPDTGKFYRRTSVCCKTGEMAQAGGLDPAGYVQINIGGHIYRAHRLAWLYMTGEWPDRVDHIDDDKANNVWSNLRQGCASKNGMSRSKQANNKSGVKGVSWSNSAKMWYAQASRKGTHLWSYHKDIGDAEQAVKKFRLELHGDWAHD